MALFVHKVSLPACVPGASSSAVSVLTLATSMPGMFSAASDMPLFSVIMISGPLACFILRPRRLPFPARILRLAFARLISSCTPRQFSASSTSLVLVSSAMSSVTISGNCGTVSMACPRNATISFDAVAAMAENSASCASLRGIRFTIIFWLVGGCGCLPPTVLGASFAVPLPPLTRGTREIPLPVPRDSAVVRFPAMGSRPCGWSRLVCVASTARFITSGLSGVLNIAGSVIFAMGFP